MPFAPADNAHTEFFYQDSGIPVIQDRPYTTLVALHGYSWNGHIFSRLLPLAAASHIRLILVNRRGYTGSTPYNDDETAAVDPAEATASTETPFIGYSAFMQQRGAEIARFLAWFIEHEKIPPRSDDKDGISGGISLVGYSLGNATSLSFLGYANTFDPGLIGRLEGYVRKLIIYDPPHHALGYRTPTNAYNPLFDPDITVEERGARFAVWISSYFSHSPAVLDLESSLRDSMTDLEQRTPIPFKRHTKANMSTADIAAGLEFGSATQGDAISLGAQARPVHEEVRLRAIFGNMNETSAPVALPNVGISYVWCTQSVWETVLAARSLRQDIVSPPSYHYPVREVKFLALEGNHFAHWDQPLKTLAAFAEALE